MKFLEEHSAIIGWGATLAVPAIYDLWAIKSEHETMSHAFRTANQHPIYKFLCLGALGGLAVHLMQEP